jgi:L-serine deaminase
MLINRFVLQNPTKSKIVISSEIGITCDELGRFIAIHSAKIDVKAPDKKIVK